MNKIYRVIDANINRASEGARVLDDLSRFYFNDEALSERLKSFRHTIREKSLCLQSKLIAQRDSANDVGLDISRKLEIDRRENLNDLVTANCKRIQEAIRSVEESLKIAGEYNLSKAFEGIRYISYSLEKACFKKVITVNKKEKLETDLYCITASDHSLGRTNMEVVKAMINAGVKIIQYREKDKSLLEKYNECREIRKLTKDAAVTFIINDDIDIAILLNADGVHIGQDDLPIEEVRKLVGEEMIIGISTHSPAQALDAVKRGADYIGVGPLYKTFTKKNVCDPVGLEYLEFAVANIKIPFVAIGGIKEHNLGDVKKKGARCVSLVTEITGAPDIEQKINNEGK